MVVGPRCSLASSMMQVVLSLVAQPRVVTPAALDSLRPICIRYATWQTHVRFSGLMTR
jgi:hypothetical protein